MSEVEPQEEHDTLEGILPPAATYRLVGHAPQWQELVAAHRSGRLHHAWLLQGPRGIGKATSAFAFARRLLAGEGAGDSPSIDPADPIARQVAGASHPNLIHITRPSADRGGGFKTQITVEEIRKLNRFFRTTTGARQWRIAIVDPADDMNRNAANALLKILEEPPERSVFLITNHLPGRLLPTIRSRCRVLRFEGLPPEETADILRAMPGALTETEIAGAASLAGGSVRTAISLASSGGLEVEAHLRRILERDEASWQEIHALADAMTLKGRETAFELMLASAFRHLAAESEERSAMGEGALSRRLATLWMEESRRLREGLAFNLDRKQLVISFFQRLFAVRAAAGGD